MANISELPRSSGGSRPPLAGSKFPRGALVGSWLALLLVDLWSLTGLLATTKPAEEIFAPSACVQRLQALHRAQPGRIVDRGTLDHGYTPLWPALPDLLALETTGGFNPTDVLRYKEYIRFITDSAQPLEPPQGPFTFPILETFPIRNKPLLDLLGVRYLLQPAGITLEQAGEPLLSADPRWRLLGTDPAPRAYDYAGGGLVALPPYELYENRAVLPRAFVVQHVEQLPDAGPEQILAALKATDFRRTVLLEHGGAPSGAAGDQPQRLARVLDQQPNRITVEVSAGAPGQLVLAEIFYPGWQATVNGQPTAIQRANYLFRSVPVPAEPCEVVFTFTPASYTWGQRLSLAGLAILVLSLLAARWRRQATSPSTGFASP